MYIYILRLAKYSEPESRRERKYIYIYIYLHISHTNISNTQIHRLNLRWLFVKYKNVLRIIFPILLFFFIC